MKKSIELICFSITCLLVTSCSLCGERVTLNETNHENNKAIVTVIKDCGATTVPSATMYLVPFKQRENLDKENPKISRKYKLLVATRANIELNWISIDELEVIYEFPILYGRQGRFDFQSAQVDGVNITYKQK